MGKVNVYHIYDERYLITSPTDVEDAITVCTCFKPAALCPHANTQISVILSHSTTKYITS